MSLIESGRCFQLDHMIGDSLWRFIVMDKEEVPDLEDGVEIFVFNQLKCDLKHSDVFLFMATNADERYFESSKVRDSLLNKSVKTRVILVYMHPPVLQWSTCQEKVNEKEMKSC